jgi:hypothetical protein
MKGIYHVNYSVDKKVYLEPHKVVIDWTTGSPTDIKTAVAERAKTELGSKNGVEAWRVSITEVKLINVLKP